MIEKIKTETGIPNFSKIASADSLISGCILAVTFAVLTAILSTTFLENCTTLYGILQYNILQNISQILFVLLYFSIFLTITFLNLNLYMIAGSKAPKAVRACTIRFLSLDPAKT